MVEAHSAPRWDGIREMIRDPLATLVQQLQTRLGENLRGVIVVGSALTDDFQPNASDINTVVLLNRHDVGTLNAVASLGRSLSRRRLSAPLLMTSFHIERSRDVFGVEFLDFQRTHETILGEDPFAAIHVEKSDVRLQCERELKAMLVRLRQELEQKTGVQYIILTVDSTGGLPIEQFSIELLDKWKLGQAGKDNGFLSTLAVKDGAWANVDAQLQRRLDLIPNLVATVQGYAGQEKEIFTRITEARTRYFQSDSIEGRIEASNQLSGALSRLLLLQEAYPQLKSDQNFRDLQVALEGTENRIAVARTRYNEAVTALNTYAKEFLGSFFARRAGVEPKPFFETTEEARTAPPKVDFSTPVQPAPQAK